MLLEEPPVLAEKIAAEKVVAEEGLAAVTGPARAPFIFAGLAMLAGIFARLAIYWQSPSLWFDEILLALNIGARGYGGASGLPLQSAPPLYLWIERACISVFGVHEMSLRLPSLIAGIATLFLVWKIAGRAGGPYVAAFAVACCALSANLCRYSNEVKPYAIDAAVAAALIFLAAPLALGSKSQPRRAVLLAAGAVSGLLSTPSIFVLAAIVLALCLREYEIGLRPARLKWIAWTALVWAASFAIVYLIFHADFVNTGYVRRFWAGALLTLSSGLPKIFTASAGALTLPSLGLEDLSLPIKIEGLILLGAGIWSIYRRFGLPLTALFSTPALCSIAAALAGRWFLVVRLMLFFAPLACVVMGMGAWYLSQLFPVARRRLAFWGIAAICLILPLRYTAWRVRYPELQANRTLAAECLRVVKPGDILYLYPRSTAAWVFYSVDWRTADPRETQRIIAAIDRGGPNAGNAPSRGGPVLHEGFDWRFVRAGRIELFGVPTGVESTTFGNQDPPDPGWADNEIDRILAEPRSGQIWIAASEYQPQAVDNLLSRLEARGLPSSPVYLGQKVALYHVSRGALGK